MSDSEKPINRWTTLDSRIAYENPWIRIREDRVIRPDGKEGIYGVLVVNPAVFVVALTGEGEVLLVRLYRYTTGSHSWEVPAGGSEGRDPLEAAKREFREEAGMEAARWEEIGTFESLNGVADSQCHVFLARELMPVENHAQEEEGITEVRAFSFETLHRMIRRGEIRDGETLSCLMIAEVYLKNEG